MRNTSKIFIYVDVQKALDAGINFYMSSNGVVLSDGDQTGYIRPRFFKEVRNVKGEVLTDWLPSSSLAPHQQPTSVDNDTTEVVELKEKTENLAL